MWTGTNLGCVPESPGDRHQFLHQLAHVVGEAAFGAVVSGGDGAEDEIDGRVGRQGAVEDGEVPLQTLRDVIAAAACRVIAEKQAVFITGRLHTKPEVSW